MLYSTALSPGAADVTATVEITTTAVPGTGTNDFDLMRASPTGKMYKVELFPRKHVAQAQCVFIGTGHTDQRARRPRPERRQLAHDQVHEDRQPR